MGCPVSPLAFNPRTQYCVAPYKGLLTQLRALPGPRTCLARPSIVR